MFSMVGGKAAREGVVTRVAVKRDRMMTASNDNGQLIDLAEEMVGRGRWASVVSTLRRTVASYLPSG
jgi:hypothetical protein